MQKTEADLAREVVQWLQDLKWEVYQEVQPFGYGNPIADIVAVQNNLIWIVECKRTLSIDLMGQAYNWQRRAHYISVATPSRRYKRKRSGIDFAQVILRQFGIGLLYVHPLTKWEREGNFRGVEEEIKPRLNRKAFASNIRNGLVEEQKTYAIAGNATGRHWSPFRATCKRIIQKVQEEPGITLKSLLEQIDTHYSSTATAKACIPKWIREGVIPEVQLEYDEQHQIKLFPAEEKSKEVNVLLQRE